MMKSAQELTVAWGFPLLDRLLMDEQSSAQLLRAEQWMAQLLRVEL